MEQDRLRATDEGKNPKWKSKKKGMILISEMDDEYLQTAYLHAQKRELYFFNRMQVFTKKIEELAKEATKRGIKLTELGSEFHKRCAHLGNSTKQYKKP